MFKFNSIGWMGRKEDRISVKFIGSGNIAPSISTTTTPIVYITDWGDSGVCVLSSGDGNLNDGIPRHPYFGNTGVFTARFRFNQGNNSIATISIRNTNIATGLLYFPDNCTGIQNFACQSHRITGIHLPPAPTRRIPQLIFNNNFIKQIDLSMVRDCDSLFLSTNELTGVDLGVGYPTMTQLLLGGNKIKYFNLPTGCQSLTNFSIPSNLLETNNFTIGAGVTGFVTFDVSSNRFTGFSLSPQWSNLTILGLNNNNFSTGLIIPSTYTRLSNLNLSVCQLSGLNLPSVSSYRILLLNSNQFTGITIPSTATGLTNFAVDNNTYTGFFSLTLEPGVNVSTFFSASTSRITGVNPLPSSFTGGGYYGFNNNFLTGFYLPSGAIIIDAQQNRIQSFVTGIAQNPYFTDLNFASNFFTQALSDSVMSQCRDSYNLNNRTSVIVNISGGSNSTPSAAGIVDRDFLRGVGWTVRTN